MNMQKTVLEAISPQEEQIRRDSNTKLSELANYVFPVDANTVQSSKIQNRLSEDKPVDFAWAASAYDGYGQDKSFLVDLARSILPERNDSLLFFPNQTGTTGKEDIKYPILSAFKGGPKVFELFTEMLGAELYKPGVNVFETKPDENGSRNIKTRDDASGLTDVTGKYHDLMERTLTVGSRIISNGAVVPKAGDFKDVVYYAAYLGYIFQCCNNALKQPNEWNGKKETIVGKNDEDKMRTLLSRGARNITKLVVDDVTSSGSSMGSLTNWGSKYNEGKNVMKALSPFELSNETLSDIKVYPKYVVDVLALTTENVNTFRSILTAHGYNSVADGLKEMVTGAKQDNKVLPISIADFEEALRDMDVIGDCLGRDIGGIFEKNGQNWATTSSLDKVLSEKPRVDNSDENTVRAIGITVAPSRKRSDTYREYTGTEIISQSHIDMVIGEATVVKDLTGKQLDADIEAAQNAGKSAEEWLNELKKGGNLPDVDKNIKQALKYKGPGAETSIAYYTLDGRTHNVKVTPDVEAKLSDPKSELQNVISRKVSTNGHTYFICVPHGVAFAAMQNEEGDVVRNDNMQTLCANLTLNGKPKAYSSVEDLMDSTIGKYCKAVAMEGKIGRIRFEPSTANTAYGTILGALSQWKAKGKTFNPRPMTTMDKVVQLFTSILIESGMESPKAVETVQPFMTNDLKVFREAYSPKQGEFVFSQVTLKNRMALAIVRHLKDMYNLDENSDEYTATDVRNILAAVVPDVWGLDGWNYGRVMKAEGAVNGTGSEPAVSEGDNLSDGGDLYNSLDEVEVGGEHFDRLEGNDADTQGEPEVEGKIGGETIDAINDAYDKAFNRLFSDYKGAPSVEDTEKLKNGIASALDGARARNEIAVNIGDKVRGIQFTDFKDFNRKFHSLIQGVAQNPSAFMNDPDETPEFARVDAAPTEATNTYVQFDKQTVNSTAGNTLIDFCLLKTEGDSHANMTELNKAFDEETGAVRNMMDRLLASVPEECLSIDYGTGEGGVARLDAKTPREAEANELSMLESYYAKKVFSRDFRQLGDYIADIYRGTPGLFAVDENRGVKSPYNYKGENIDLDKVNTLFTSLMKLASLYNDIGTSESGSVSSQVRTQQTMNNDIQSQKVLNNEHFSNLKASFDTIYNGLQNGGQLTPQLTRVLDKVMKQVVSNPMNVLINNNARLISAYAYHKAVTTRKRQSLTGFTSEDSKKGIGVEGYVRGRSRYLDRTIDAMKFVYGVIDALRNTDIPNGITSAKAEADYKEYLDDMAEFNSDGDANSQYAMSKLNDAERNAKEVRSEYLRSHKGDYAGANKAYETAKANSIADIKDNTTFFCDYAGDIQKGARESESAFTDRIGKIRTNELMLLLRDTVYAIINSRANFPKTFKDFMAKIAAQGKLIESDAIKSGEVEIVPQALIDKVFALDAELELANSEARNKVLSDGAAVKSNNNVVQNAVNYGRGLEKHPEERTSELVDRILDDKPLDNSVVDGIVSGMQKKGNPSTGTNMTFKGKFNVKSVDANDIVIATNTKLYDNDAIQFTAPDGSEKVTYVKSIISDDDKEYNIPNVGGLSAGNKDIPFIRYQSRNEFVGFDLESKLGSVLKKLVGFYEKSQKSNAVDAEDLKKMILLTMLYEGSNAAPVVKSIVGYFAWRAARFNSSLNPEKISFNGDVEGGIEDSINVIGVLVTTIAKDLQKYGPKGDSRDDEVYKTILDTLPAAFDDYARKYAPNLDLTPDVREGAMDVAQNVRTTSRIMDTENTLKQIVETIGRFFGYVKRSDVENFCKSPRALAKLNGLTQEDGQKLLGLINGSYKTTLDEIIERHNWSIAEPLVTDYKQNAGDSANFDDAIKYVKENYDIKKLQNDTEFADYIKTKCAYRVKQIIESR